MLYGKSTPNELYIPALPAVDLNTAANPGIYATLKDYKTAAVYLTIGQTAGGTCVVTMKQATALAGTGEKALAFTKYYQTGQKLIMNTVVGAFAAAETVTGGTSGNTATVIKASSDHLWVTLLTGTTTWTTGETLTGGTSGATALLDGTGQNEDVLLEQAAVVSTFTTLAIVNQTYMIPIDGSMLDTANDFDCFRIHVAQAGVGSTLGSCVYLLGGAPVQYPQVSALGALKLV